MYNDYFNDISVHFTSTAISMTVNNYVPVRTNRCKHGLEIILFDIHVHLFNICTFILLICTLFKINKIFVVVKDNLSKIACIISCAYQENICTFEWRPFNHVAIDHKSLTVNSGKII